MQIFLMIYSAVLFFLLTPNILVTLPPTSSKYVIAATHGILFAVIYMITHPFVTREGYSTVGLKRVECFAKCECMTLEDGTALSFANAKIGDRILTTSLDGSTMKYSKIASLPHQGDNTVSEFYQLITESGRTLLVTADHLVALAPSYQLTPAKNILIGQSLHTVAGPEKVVDINIVLEHGIATAVTEDGGLIVVNGFVVSPFGKNHEVLDVYCNLHRVFKSEMVLLDPIVNRVAMTLAY